MAYGAGPGPLAHPDCAALCGDRGDWVYQGQECHRRCSPVWWTTKKLQRERFCPRRYAVSTRGFETAQMRDSIKHQELLDA
jgi:hypothetical protein